MVVSGLALVAVLGGCHAPQERLPETVTVGRPIFYGTPDTNPAHMAVVALTYGPQSGYFCSGTLIRSDVVLTAAHCLQGEVGTSVYAFFGANAYLNGQHVQGLEIHIHPQYDDQNVQNDIALLLLAEDAPTSITPIPYLPAAQGLTAADEGAVLDFSGFGLTENSTDGEKLHVEQVLGKVCPGPSGCPYLSGWVVAEAFGYPQSGGGPCSGDSGGPAFFQRGGQEYVAGVTSYGDTHCVEYGVSTTVDDKEEWIEGIIGTTPDEDCDNSIDDDEDGQTDCADADCATHPSCQGPDACQGAAAIGCGDVVQSTTNGGPVYFAEYSCLAEGFLGGPEKAFSLNVPDGIEVTADLQITGNGDLDLFLLPAAGASCNPQGCLDASFNEGTAPETLTFTTEAAAAYLVVDTFDESASFTLSLSCPTAGEQCANLIDDDGDGQTDCADADCSSDPACQSIDGGTDPTDGAGADDGGSGGPDGGATVKMDPTSYSGGCSCRVSGVENKGTGGLGREWIWGLLVLLGAGWAGGCTRRWNSKQSGGNHA